MASDIFRQSALDRLSSPEQLDRAIRLSAPHDWMAVVVLCVFLGVAIGWSILGSIPTIVRGSGILLATGGRVFDAYATGEGSVIELLPKIGDTVKKGDVLARITQTNLELTLTNASAVLQERAAQLDERRKQIDVYALSRKENTAARRRALEEKIGNSQQRADAVERQLVTEEKMFEQRLITWQKLQESRQELSTARQNVFDGRSQLVQLDAEEINSRNADERDIQLARERLGDAERKLAETRLQLQQSEKVLSPADGRITEFKVAPGGRVLAGSSIASIESGVTGIQLVLYLPPDQGKQVKPGMDVRVSPSTIKREEYGTIIGTVREVSDFPATGQAMLATLQNDKLVAQFSARGAPFATRIDLTRDPSTVTGYKWSGGSGPPTLISSGTIADAEVTVSEDAPITFVIPLIRKMTGLDR
jgi:HlyD family secretion protein